MRAVIHGAYTAGAPIISGNGLITGHYNAPIFDFLFPENLGAAMQNDVLPRLDVRPGHRPMCARRPADCECTP